MPFLSLGLLKDEQQASPAQTQADETVADDTAVLGLSFSQRSESCGTPSATASSAAKRPSRAELLAATHSSDEEQHSSLPHAVEELRRRLFESEFESEKDAKPEFRFVVNDGTPTFRTFKFGY